MNHLRDRSDLAAAFRVVGPSRRLPTETELALFRIGQAALHNVELHAEATDVEIELAFEPAHVRLCVTDDGCGCRGPAEPGRCPQPASSGWSACANVLSSSEGRCS